MALHGEVKVNNHVIATWEAVRNMDTPPMRYNGQDNVSRYDCVVHYTNSAGYKMKAEFEVMHAYEDGALALSSEVLKRAQNWLRPVRMWEGDWEG